MARRLEVVVVGDTKDLERALGRAGSAGTTFGQSVKRGARIAGLALGGVLAVGARAGFKELEEGAKVAAQTNAVLKSTGGVANVTAGHVTDLATSLSDLSGVDDEVIQSGENVLLTFKNVRNEVGAGNDIFDQATEAILDFSVAMGIDMSSAAVMVGKALNDPATGLTTLRRKGVQFNEAATETIKKLFETGHAAQAQKMILAELNTEFGGSAKAFGETLPGQIGKARNAFDEMSGALLLSLLPAMTAVSGALLTFSEFMEAHPKLAKGMTIALIALTAALLTAASAQAILNLAVLANPYVAAAAAALAVAAALVVLYEKSEKFRNAVNLLKDNWRTLLTAMAVVAPFLAIIAHWGTIKTAATSAKNAVGEFITKVAQIVTGTIKAVTAAFDAVIDKAKAAIDKVGDFIAKVAKVVSGPVGAVADAFNSISGAVRSAIGWIGDLIDKINSIPSPHLPGWLGGRVVAPGPSLGEAADGSKLPLSGAGGSFTVVTPVYLDGREIYRSVKSYAASDFRRNG